VTEDAGLAEAANALSRPDMSGSDLCAVFVATVPVERAAISTLRRPFDIETVGASDTVASALDEVQIDLGEGPCWDALASRSPVVLAHLGADRPSAWPAFTEAVAAYGVTSVYAFPLTLGTLEIGAIDLYNHVADPLTDAQLAGVSSLTGITALQVVRHSMAHRDDDPSEDGPFSRREVHQATGMVIAQMGVSATDALLLLRAHSYSTGRPVREIAADVVARRITFTP